MARPTVAQVLRVARGQLQYVEGHDNDTKYGEWFGLNHQPWSDIFVSWCGAQVDGTDTIGRFSYAPSHAKWFQDKKRWGTTPKVGAIAFFNLPDGPHRIHHVGIVEAVRSDGRIVTIEGNTSVGISESQEDRGGVYRRVRATDHVKGYGYPNYAVASRQLMSTAVSPAVVWPGRYLQHQDPPMSGEDVRAWQTQMAKRGWSIAVDGTYGPRSRDVLVAFQRMKGLIADGVLGPESWKAAFESKIW